MTALATQSPRGVLAAPASPGVSTPGTGALTAATVEHLDPVLLMGAASAMSRTDIEALPAADAEAFVIACERAVAGLQARQTLAMDVLAARVGDQLEQRREDHPLPSGVPGPDPHSMVASMLAPALRMSTRAVHRRLLADRWMTSTTSSTFSAHWDGDLERHRADVVVEASQDVGSELVDQFEAMVLETSVDPVTGELRLVSERVRQMSRAELSRRAVRVARAVDPQSVARAEHRGRQQRSVVVTPERRQPGLARWTALLPAEVSHQVFAAVDGLAGQYARANAGTPIEAHRADALADLVLGNATIETTLELVVPVLPADRGSASREAASIHEGGIDAPPGLTGALAELHPVTATVAPTAAAASSTAPSAPPASVRWLVPGTIDDPRHGAFVPQAVAELLSHPGTLVRLARLDPDGSLVQDPHAYRPSASLRRRVRARDGCCRFPGCHVPAARTDTDHVVAHPWGPTAPTNLISLCRTHHLFKHHGGWHPELFTDGTVTWRAPDGRTWTTQPVPHAIREELRFADGLEPGVAHDLRRGWFPGLPPGMSMADLLSAERSLPDDPPASNVVPMAPPDWERLGDQVIAVRPTPARTSPWERRLVELLAAAA